MLLVSAAGITAVLALSGYVYLRVVIGPQKQAAERSEALKPADRSEALDNIRQVGVALANFEATYGKFPDATTISLVTRDTGTELTLGDASSNQLFRQLMAAGLKSEKRFWAKTASTPRKPDGIFSPGKALEPGECAFGYVAGLSSSSSDLGAPVLFAPLVPGTLRFDPAPYQGKAVIYRVGGSVSTLDIDPSGRVLDPHGRDLFDPTNPIWRGKPPDIRLPE